MQANAKFYDANLIDHPHVDDRLRKVMALIVAARPATLLDVGCGRGTLIAALGERIATQGYVGTEISETLCALARASGVSVVAHDLADPLPFPDESYQTVVLGELIEHLFDPDAALDDIRRVLVPGGTLIVTTPNLACWLNRVLVPLGIQPLYTEPSSRKKYGRRFRLLGQRSSTVEGHIRVMTTTALLELLRDRGYRIARVAGYKFWHLEINPITSFIDGLFCTIPAFASGAIVVAIKT